MDSAIYRLYGMYRGILVEPMAVCSDKRHDFSHRLFAQVPQPRERGPKQTCWSSCRDYPGRPRCASGRECCLRGRSGHRPSPMSWCAVWGRGGGGWHDIQAKTMSLGKISRGL